MNSETYESYLSGAWDGARPATVDGLVDWVFGVPRGQVAGERRRSDTVVVNWTDMRSDAFAGRMPARVPVGMAVRTAMRMPVRLPLRLEAQEERVLDYGSLDRLG